MPVEAQRFSFTEIDKSLGAASSLPYLPLTLNYQDTSLSVSGLLDTGATVNVLPYDIGRQQRVLKTCIFIVEATMPPEDHWETEDPEKQAEDRCVKMTLVTVGRQG